MFFLGLGMVIDLVCLGFVVVMLLWCWFMLNLFVFWVGGMVVGVGIVLVVLVFMCDVVLVVI